MDHLHGQKMSRGRGLHVLHTHPHPPLGAAGEKFSWMRTVGELENSERHLLGDVIVASAQVAYLGQAARGWASGGGSGSSIMWMTQS